MELKKTITRAIESRQAKLDKRNGVSVFTEHISRLNSGSLAQLDRVAAL